MHTSCQTSCSDDGGGTTLVLKTTGGGSTTGGNTASEAFNDRIKACADGGGPGDAPIGGDEMTPDQAFCNAISQIINTCDRFSLGSAYNRSLLEDIAMIRECGDRDPETDDAGMLTEVAEFVCSQGPNDYTTSVVKDYVDYAVMQGLHRAVSFEDFLQISDFINHHELDIGLSELMGQFDLEDCLSQCEEAPPLEDLSECAASTINETLDECLEPLDQIYTYLAINSLKNKLDICDWRSDDNEDPPGCTGCSVGEAEVVTLDKIEAREMLKCAIEKLEAYDGLSPLEVKTALFSHFGGNSSIIVANYVEALLKFVRFASATSEFKAQNIGEGLCHGNTSAWAIPSSHLTDVRLCRPTYWNLSEVKRAGVLIHEWMHLFYFAGDLAYDFDDEYQELNTLQQLFNADSFSEFAKSLCGDE